MNLKKIIPMALLLFWSSTFFAQEEQHAKSQEHEFKNFRIALALGHGYIPSAEKTDGNFLIIPAFGLDIQYWFNKKWGIGLKNDIEIADYSIENKEDHTSKIERKNPIIVSLPLLINPWGNGLTFLVGPGIELEEHENFSIFRLGIGYEFEMANHWDFEPEILYDLKNSHINSFTISFGVGKRF